MFIATSRLNIALDIVVAVDGFADVQHFLVGQVLDPLFGVIPSCGDLLGRGAADSVNVGQRDFHALVGGDVDPGNTSHSLPSSSSTGRQPPHLVARKSQSETKNRRAHECAAGNRWNGIKRQIGMRRNRVKPDGFGRLRRSKCSTAHAGRADPPDFVVERHPSRALHALIESPAASRSPDQYAKRSSTRSRPEL